MVRRERARLVGSAAAELRRTLIARFLDRTLSTVRGPILEVGPGTGRFTEGLGALGRPLVLVDLARPMLRASRRTIRRWSGGSATPNAFVQAAAERLPFAAGRFGAVVLVGLFGFFARDGPGVLREAARVLRPGGRVVVETQSASHAIGSILPGAPRAATRILRRPRLYHLDRILRHGYQPLDPIHLAHWEYRYWRPGELEATVRSAGLRTVDRMSVGAALGLHGEVLRALRRDPAAWRTLIDCEETVGRWPESFGAGASFLLAAERPASPTSRRRR